MTARYLDLSRGPAFLAIQAAVDEAAQLLRRGREHQGVMIAKGDRDFATAVDAEAERAVRHRLQELTPGIGFLGEEEGGAPLGAAATWVLDPIDGTVNYARGSPLCGISLALVEDGRPKLAVVDLPFIGERFVAVEGGGAYLNGRRLHVAERPLRDAIIGFTDFSVGHDAPVENALHLRLMGALARTALRVRLHGSEALDLAWVACGRLNGAIMLSNLPWDVSGGVLLVREAGGVVTDLDGAEHGLASASTIAATPSAHEELLAVLRGSGP
jgi:myo-inositol-1(or 4)-monophosphatase